MASCLLIFQSFDNECTAGAYNTIALTRMPLVNQTNLSAGMQIPTHGETSSLMHATGLPLANVVQAQTGDRHCTLDKEK
jgi:hypothetical protein